MIKAHRWEKVDIGVALRLKVQKKKYALKRVNRKRQREKKIGERRMKERGEGRNT